MDDIGDTIFAGILIIGLIVAACLGLWWLCSIPGRWSCSDIASNMHKEYNYSLISGCFIESKDGFVPLKNYRYMGE